jgi:hypothetical protein
MLLCCAMLAAGILALQQHAACGLQGTSALTSAADGQRHVYLVCCTPVAADIFNGKTSIHQTYRRATNDAAHVHVSNLQVPEINDSRYAMQAVQR